MRAIKELPAAAESSIREALKEFENEKPGIVEAYIHPNNSFIVLDPGLTDHDIVEECTADFANKTIVNIYYNHDEHLYQIEPRSANEIVWYHSRPDESNQFSVLSEIWDIDDMIPFTKFQLTNKYIVIRSIDVNCVIFMGRLFNYITLSTKFILC